MYADYRTCNVQVLRPMGQSSLIVSSYSGMEILHFIHAWSSNWYSELISKDLGTDCPFEQILIHGGTAHRAKGPVIVTIKSVNFFQLRIDCSYIQNHLLEAATGRPGNIVVDVPKM